MGSNKSQPSTLRKIESFGVRVIFFVFVNPICVVIVIPGLDVAGLDDVTLGLLVVVDVVDGLLGGLLVAGALVVTAEGLNSTLPLPLQRPGSTSSQSQGV